MPNKNLNLFGELKKTLVNIYKIDTINKLSENIQNLA